MPTSASPSVLLRALPVRRPRSAAPVRPGRSADDTPRPSRWRRTARRWFLGGPDEPRLARPLLWLLLVGTAALYLVDLTSSGYANEFYAAAVKSGTESLRAWLFGSLDAASSITVDKPPASLWVMVLFARVLGFSSFSLLLPQALMGVGAVATLYATVRRWAGAYAGLVAGALLALTPVAALMFRFDNPDAMLVLLMTLAAYAVVRAVDAPDVVGEGARSALRWMVVAGALVGVAFLTKMAQGLLVLPAFGLVYLVVSPLRLRARLGHLLAATGAMVVAAGWYVVLVELWPASARPYIGGSTNNSLWELAIGYNGLGRIFSGTGNGTGGGGGGFGGTAGLLRLFNTEFATQISWLVPAALVALVAGLVVTRRASSSASASEWSSPGGVGGRPPTQTLRTRAALLLWGTWLVVTAVVFSFMSGTVHPYYSVALAPALAAVIAVGGRVLWLRRETHLARAALAVMIAGTAVWGFVLMRRDAGGWMTWLAWTMLVGGVLGALVLAVSAGRLKRWAVAGLLVGTLSALAGTASFTAATVATGHTGSTPTAGPAIVATASGFGAGHGGPAGAPSGQQPPSSTSGSTSTGTVPAQGQGGTTSTSSTALTDLLDATSTRWSAAVVGAQSASPLILSSSTAVMAVGGWSGSDDSPTLAQFQAYVADGDISYFLVTGNGAGGGGMQGGTDSSSSQITAWVEAHFSSTTVGGTTVYDLTSPTS